MQVDFLTVGADLVSGISLLIYVSRSFPIEYIILTVISKSHFPFQRQIMYKS